MNHKNITPGTLVEGSVSSTDISSDEINQFEGSNARYAIRNRYS